MHATMSAPRAHRALHVRIEAQRAGRAFLEARGIAPADLQAAVDARVERVRAAVAAEAAEPPEPT